MTTQGKENGENLLDHYVEEIITDSKLVHEDCIIIDDFAKYLMSKWLIIASVKSYINDFLYLLLYYFLKIWIKQNAGIKTALSLHPQHIQFLIGNDFNPVLWLWLIRHVTICREGGFFLSDSHLVEEKYAWVQYCWEEIGSFRVVTDHTDLKSE